MSFCQLAGPLAGAWGFEFGVKHAFCEHMRNGPPSRKLVYDVSSLFVEARFLSSSGLCLRPPGTLIMADFLNTRAHGLVIIIQGHHLAS